MKRKHLVFTLRDAMQLLQVESFTLWALTPPPLLPSEHLLEDMRRFEAFDQENSEVAKLLLLDALFAEIVPRYPNLKIWKAAPLESDVLTGVADYLIAPKRAIWQHHYSVSQRPRKTISYRGGRSASSRSLPVSGIIGRRM